MSKWKIFTDIDIPEGLTEKEAIAYIKAAILPLKYHQTFDFFIKQGLLKLNLEAEKPS